MKFLMRDMRAVIYENRNFGTKTDWLFRFSVSAYKDCAADCNVKYGPESRGSGFLNRGCSAHGFRCRRRRCSVLLGGAGGVLRGSGGG